MTHTLTDDAVLSLSDRLETFAQDPHTLLAFDFDGTLTAIQSDPDQVSLSEHMTRVLLTLETLRPCAILSGRALLDLERRCHRLQKTLLIGNHGIESPFVSAALQENFRTWVREKTQHVAQVLKNWPGVRLENKEYSLSIHYRHSPTPNRDSQRIEQLLTSLAPNGRLLGGKFVWNLIPPFAPDKGDALLQVAQSLGSRRIVYIGDDLTDEDAFEKLNPARVGVSLQSLTVFVGCSDTTRAQYQIRSPSDVALLLEDLARHLAKERRV